MAHTLASRTRAEILLAIDAFLTERNMSESAFGLRAANDVKVVKRIRSGANVTLGTIARIEAFMERLSADAVAHTAAQQMRRDPADMTARHPDPVAA